MMCLNVPKNRGFAKQWQFIFFSNWSYSDQPYLQLEPLDVTILSNPDPCTRYEPFMRYWYASHSYEQQQAVAKKPFV